MVELFDEEYIQMAYHKRLQREIKAEVTAEIKAEVKAKVAAEVKEKVREKERRSVRKLCQKGFSAEEIADISEVPVETVKQWIEL